MVAKIFSFEPYFAKSIDYQTYLALTHDLVSEGKTSGPNQSEDLAAYTKLNLQRMERLNKTIVLQPELIQALKNIKAPQTWLVITEAWCGDAAQNIPLFAKLADVHPYIKLRFVFRDENLDLIDRYLTNGGRAIPMLIVFDENHKEVFKWGPRPTMAQEMVNEYKQNPVQDMETFKTLLHTWYAKDKTHQQQAEFIALLGK